ncbi:adenosylcobinamide-phosphate synthase [Haloactinopolyspora alba]|uniref:Cobalamin biosynthesis protein CobD n=1 Tax=Haloactinopolyspora alba TaxID=648780 RepID=A0A2P8E6P1_9ACTN|nr:adenosylcobinamide-phosphate synthase CbiB [Haloactinopolyspora alba]PSL05152.1 adenosylcobinamide-phosphate synthase [Haloactinopolyspora alba]
MREPSGGSGRRHDRSSTGVIDAGAVVVAVALDRALGEPPTAVHPVRMMGRCLDLAARIVPAAPAPRARVAGGAAWTTGAAAALASGVLLERVADRLPSWGRVVVLGTVVWPLFAHRLLLDEVDAVERALASGLPEARAAVRRIVSRDMSAATEGEIRQAAVESLGENLSDSVVAPLFWFAVGGLPAAVLYRFVNTADAMWGYRTPRWRHAGTVAARADDLMNLLPARVTGLALAFPAVRPGAVRREAARTPSPNAGWPMAALALHLGVRLEKPGVYTLGAHGREPTADDTAGAARLARRRGWALAAAAAVLAVVNVTRGRR